MTLNNLVPVKSADDVIVNEPGSPVCTVQVPSLRSVPPLTVHPDGTSAMVIVTTAPSFADAAASPRLIGSPATPAGAIGGSWKIVPVPASCANCQLAVL